MNNNLLDKKTSLETNIDRACLDSLYQKASSYIYKARQSVQKSINVEMIETYWLIGRDIVETEQQGQEKSEYGKSILKELSSKLQTKYKNGFSVDTLEKARRFYLTYQVDFEQIQKSATVSRKSMELTSLTEKDIKNQDLPLLVPNLSWSHYESFALNKKG